MTARHWIAAFHALKAVENAGIDVAARVLLVVHRGADVCAVLAARRWVRDLSDEDTRLMTRGRR